MTHRSYRYGNRSEAVWLATLRWFAGRAGHGGRPKTDDQNLATIEDVDALYRLILGRQPDAAGYRLYQGMVERRSISVDALVGAFLSSPEFRDRVRREFTWGNDAVESVDLLDGYTFYVGAQAGGVGADIKAGRRYEPHVSRRLSSVLGPGSTFVDVGASIGYFTVMAGRIVGTGGRVIAVEPGPQNHSVLLLNVYSNGLENVDLHKVAASDRPEILTYSRLEDNGCVGSFDGDPTVVGVQELVQARTLDDLLGSVAKVDVVKVDVEGAEGKVLRGANRIITRDRPVIFFELNRDALELVSGVTASDLLEWLTGLGYALTVLRKDASGEPDTADQSPSELRAVVEELESSGADHLDIVATRPDGT